MAVKAILTKERERESGGKRNNRTSAQCQRKETRLLHNRRFAVVRLKLNLKNKQLLFLLHTEKVCACMCIRVMIIIVQN